MSDWKDITGSFAERDRALDMQAAGQAIVRRRHNGWFVKLTPAGEQQAAEDKHVAMLMDGADSDEEADAINDHFAG